MKLLYFAWIRERIGVAEEEVSAPAEVVDVSSLLDWLAGRGPGYAAAMADRQLVRVAINQDYARDGDPLSDGDEVALFPPVTGG